MTLKCTGCGAVARNETDIRFCRIVMHKNGDPCGSLMMPYDEKIEAPKPRKESE